MSDLLAGGVAVLALVAALELGTTTDLALVVLTISLIVWPAGLLLLLGVRWAVQGDLKSAAMVLVLTVAAVVSAVGGTLLAR